MFGPDFVGAAPNARPMQSILSSMRLARVLGAIGRGLISAGVIVLLFVAYQLWGTGIQNAAAQGNLTDDFAAQTGLDVDGSDTESLAELARESQEAIGEGRVLFDDRSLDDIASNDAESEDEPETAELVEQNLDAATNQQIQAKLYPSAGEAFARINIPAISVDQIAVAGVSVEDLRKGPGHYTSTPNPGQAGNAAIAGHRTTYGAPFHRIDELQPNDPIFVQTAQGVFEYRVIGFEDPAGGPERGYFIVSPSDTWVLDQQEGQNILTLTACHPKYSARQRIIVQAELVGEPVMTIPRDEAAELGEVTLDSGATDERAQAAPGDNGDDIPEDEQVIIGDDVAADDDPTVDADGNPIEDGAGDDDIAEATETDNDSSSDDPVETETDTETDEDADVVAAVAIAAGGEDDGTASGGTASAESADEAVDLSVEGAELASTQTTTDDFGEGLNGDPTKVQPAVMWGISGLFIWIAAWFMGQRLDRKWTLYAVGLIPFAVVLWSTFVNVDQALPSY